MAEFLFTTDSEMKATTLLGFAVDPDRYKFCISEAMDNTIEPMLGTELYDVIAAGAEAGTLTGDYLVLYNEYVKPVTKYAGLAEYLLIASYTLDNAGLFKRAPENSTAVEKEEADFLSGRYMNKAQNRIDRFEKWIGLNPLDEYKASQDEVDAQNVTARGGWFFE